MIWLDIWGKWFGLDQWFDNLVNGLITVFHEIEGHVIGSVIRQL